MGQIQAIADDISRLEAKQLERDHIRAKLDADEAGDKALLADLRTAVAVLRRYEPTQPTAAVVAPRLNAPDVAPPAPKRRVKSDSDSITELMSAVKALVTASRGLKTNELYQKIVEAGISIPGESPVKNFSTILTRNKAAYGIDSTRRDGWFLVIEKDALVSGALRGSNNDDL